MCIFPLRLPIKYPSFVKDRCALLASLLFAVFLPITRAVGKCFPHSTKCPRSIAVVIWERILYLCKNCTSTRVHMNLMGNVRGVCAGYSTIDWIRDQ